MELLLSIADLVWIFQIQLIIRSVKEESDERKKIWWQATQQNKTNIFEKKNKRNISFTEKFLYIYMYYIYVCMCVFKLQTTITDFRASDFFSFARFQQYSTTLGS